MFAEEVLYSADRDDIILIDRGNELSITICVRTMSATITFSFITIATIITLLSFFIKLFLTHRTVVAKMIL